MIPTAVFLAVLLLLWASGVSVFVHATLTRRRKILWTLLLAGVGVAIGVVLPLAAIRDRFFLLLLLLPVLAVIDIKIAKSNRSFLFWFRACSFEVSTVFLAAAVTRGVLAA
jgi:hypothetical protein